MLRHIFLAGVPATGKTWLGSWLAEHEAYIHIDAERDGGRDFDQFGLHDSWNVVVASGRADKFVAAANSLKRPVIINWGFPTCFLYVVKALQLGGVEAWWLHGPRAQARTAFVARGGIDPRCFDKQMDDIEREWLLISSVFQGHIVTALGELGEQRHPRDLWAEMGRPANSA